MTPFATLVECTESFPKTLRFCKICRQETSHLIRENAGSVVRVCMPCLEERLAYELDRD